MPNYRCQMCGKSDDEQGPCCKAIMAPVIEEKVYRQEQGEQDMKNGTKKKGGKKGGC